VEEAAPEPRPKKEAATQEPGPSRASSPPLPEILEGLPGLTPCPRPSANEELERMQTALFAS
jgi:hypothetical protein